MPHGTKAPRDGFASLAQVRFVIFYFLAIKSCWFFALVAMAFGHSHWVQSGALARLFQLSSQVSGEGT